MKQFTSLFLTAFIVCSCILPLLPPAAVAADGWQIDPGSNKVYINDSRVYLSAEPHTIASPGWVTFTLQSKQFTGDIDVVWGFDLPTVQPKKAQRYAPYWNNWTINSTETFYYVSAFAVAPPNATCDYGFPYNSKHYIVNHAVPQYGEEGFNITDWQPTTSIVCFDNYTKNDVNYTVTWSEQHSQYIEWQSFNGGFEVIPKSHGGMNTWYLLKNVAVEAGETYILRAWIDMPISTEPISGKYWWCLKPSALSLSEAIAQDKFYSLDPWYNAAWSHRILWTATNPTDEELTNFPILLNVTIEDEMQDDLDDCVFTDLSNTVLPFELDYEDDVNALLWANDSIPASSSVSGYLYYGNDAATSQADPEGVWDSSYVLVSHMNDDPDTSHIADSTSYGNDGTKKGANEPAEVAGAIGRAQSFDGGDDYVNCGNAFNSTIITVEVFEKANSVPERRFISKWDYGAAKRSWLMSTSGVIAGTNKLEIYVSDDGTLNLGHYKRYASSLVAFDNTYHQTAFTFNAGVLSLFIDGDLDIAPVKSVDGAITTIYQSTLATLFGGTINNGAFGAAPFPGAIDETRISNVARPPEWIEAGYEFVVNQSAWVTWGAATTCPCPCPPAIANETGNFWANFTFTPDNDGCPLTTDGYNVSWDNGTDSGWVNTTDPWANITANPHGWVNITVWSWNETEGALSCDNITESIGPWANHVPVISGCEDIFYGNTGFNVTLDLNYTDLDEDICTFSTDFPYGTLNETTGKFNWTILPDMIGVYYANFTVNDSYGGENTCTVVIGNLDMLIYLQNLYLVEEQEMLGGAVIVLFLLVSGLALFFAGLYAGNAILVLMATALFFISAALPAPLFEGYIAIALIGILLILGLVALMYSFYLFWMAYSSHKSWHKWDSYFEEQR